jgi:pSer/pThr/pTyr-binding forkhead associated (FHA) protein
MICASCHSENPTGHTFCHACGAPLTRASVSRPTLEPFRACPRCGSDQAPADKYCSACGHDLTAPVTRTVHPIHDASWAGPSVRVAAPSGVPCPRCGVTNEAQARTCRYCGGVVNAFTQPAPDSVSDLAIDLNPQACVVVILRDGTDGGVYPLIQDRTDIGGREGDIVLKEDPYLSARHARIERRGDSFVLLDLGSVNGIYLRLRQPTTLADGDMILLGQQVLRFELTSEVERHVGAAMQHGVMIFGTPEQSRLARLVQYTTEGMARDVYYLHRNETVFGREAADLTFSDDPFLSRKHAAIVCDPHGNENERKFVLRDLGSSNGTAICCRTEHVLQSGDQFRLGRHLFRFDLGIPSDAPHAHGAHGAHGPNDSDDSRNEGQTGATRDSS